MTIFIITERKANTPLIDFKLIVNRIILASDILLLISFLSMFTVYQIFPFLVRSPVAVGGFGVDPYLLQTFSFHFWLFFSFRSFFWVYYIQAGKNETHVYGKHIAVVEFFSIFIMHSTTAFLGGLAIIATCLSLIQVGVFNIALESTPRHLSGTSLGTIVLLILIGRAVGPVIAEMIMQTNQVSDSWK